MWFLWFLIGKNCIFSDFWAKKKECDFCDFFGQKSDFAKFLKIPVYLVILDFFYLWKNWNFRPKKLKFLIVLCLCRGNAHQATKIFVCQLCLSIIYPYHQKGHAIFSLVTNNTWLWISSKNSSRVGQVYKGLNPDGGSVPDHPVILTKER